MHIAFKIRLVDALTYRHRQQKIILWQLVSTSLINSEIYICFYFDIDCTSA